MSIEIIILKELLTINPLIIQEIFKVTEMKFIRIDLKFKICLMDTSIREEHLTKSCFLDQGLLLLIKNSMIG